MYILETRNITKRYRKFKALDDCNIHIEKGSIYGLVGRNGAGKTTLIRVICGLQRPSQGEYYIYGNKNDSKEILESRKRMGAIVETPSIYLDMSAKDNLKEHAKIIGLPSEKTIEEILKLVGLEETNKKKARNFSLRYETKIRNRDSFNW